MSHPNEGDFADDETVGASNRKHDYDDENTISTTDMSEETIDSEEESSAEDENENDYSPPTNTTRRPTRIIMPTRSKAWKRLIQANNLMQMPRAHAIFDAKRVTRSVKHAISDSGATGHFLVEDAPVVNKQVAANPISITLPNGKTIKSTHTCNLDIPWLPHVMTEAHIVPGLAHSSLIATRKFCDAGCRVIFDLEECRVYFKGKLVLAGKRDITNGLWRLPINPATAQGRSNSIHQQDLHLLPTQQLNHAANNVHTLPYLQNQVKYMHQTFSAPPNSPSSRQSTTTN